MRGALPAGVVLGECQPAATGGSSPRTAHVGRDEAFSSKCRLRLATENPIVHQREPALLPTKQPHVREHTRHVSHGRHRNRAQLGYSADWGVDDGVLRPDAEVPTLTMRTRTSSSAINRQHRDFYGGSFHPHHLGALLGAFAFDLAALIAR